MSDLDKIVAIFPVVFMLHDFEEIIGFESWLKNNREELARRFPRIEKRFDKGGMFLLSTSTFAFAVCVIFVLVSLMSFISLYLGIYQWWFVVFSAFFVHLFIHIGQWIVYGKYIPAIITSFLSLPYCFYAFYVVFEYSDFSVAEMLFWMFLGTILMLIIVPCVLNLAGRLQKTLS